MARSLIGWFAGRNRMTLIAGAVGAAALSLGTTASLGGFSASIQNTGDKVATGSLIMQEQVTPTGGTTTTCLSTAAGSTITNNANNTANGGGCNANKFGALTNAVPGSTSFSTVIVQNQGSVTANSFNLTTGACSAVGQAGAGAAATNVGSDTGSNSGFCSKVDVSIEDDTTTGSFFCVYPSTPGTACLTPTSSNTLTTLATAYASTPLSLTAPIAAGGSRTYKVTVLIDGSATNADQAMAATLPITFNFGS